MNLLNRLLATLFALALFLGGLLAAIDIVLLQVDRPTFLVPTGQWASWFRVQSFGDGIIRAVCVGLALLGLLLLLVALRRGKPHALRLPARTDSVQVSTSRRGLQRALSAAAGRVDGVSSASTKARRRSVRVHAVTALRDHGDLQQRLVEAVTSRLDDFGLTDRLRPRVKVSTKGSR